MDIFVFWSLQDITNTQLEYLPLINIIFCIRIKYYVLNVGMYKDKILYNILLRFCGNLVAYSGVNNI